MEGQLRIIKNVKNIKTRVKYIVSYFNNSLSYSRVRRSDSRGFSSRTFPRNLYYYKMVRSHRFCITYPREISRDSRIYLKRLLIALLLSSMRRSQSDVTDVHSKTWLTADVCGRKPEIQNINNLIYLDNLQAIIQYYVYLIVVNIILY